MTNLSRVNVSVQTSNGIAKRKKRRIERTSTSTSKTKTGWLTRFNPDGTFKKDRISIDRKNAITNIVD